MPDQFLRILRSALDMYQIKVYSEGLLLLSVLGDWEDMERRNFSIESSAPNFFGGKNRLLASSTIGILAAFALASTLSVPVLLDSNTMQGEAGTFKIEGVPLDPIGIDAVNVDGSTAIDIEFSRFSADPLIIAKSEVSSLLDPGQISGVKLLPTANQVGQTAGVQRQIAPYALQRSNPIAGNRISSTSLRLMHPVTTRTISSPYGWRTNPTGAGRQIHIGQDYPIACGSPVYASEAGIVTVSGWAGHSGQRITIDHGNNVQTGYSHNSRLIATVGQRVLHGQLIALAGTTGNSTGCHVHFEVIINGRWHDPRNYLPGILGQRQALIDSRGLTVNAGSAAQSRQSTNPPSVNIDHANHRKAAVHSNQSAMARQSNRGRVSEIPARPKLVRETPTATPVQAGKKSPTAKGSKRKHTKKATKKPSAVQKAPKAPKNQPKHVVPRNKPKADPPPVVVEKPQESVQKPAPTKSPRPVEQDTKQQPVPEPTKLPEAKPSPSTPPVPSLKPETSIPEPPVDVPSPAPEAEVQPPVEPKPSPEAEVPQKTVPEKEQPVVEDHKEQQQVVPEPSKPKTKPKTPLPVKPEPSDKRQPTKPKLSAPRPATPKVVKPKAKVQPKPARKPEAAPAPKPVTPKKIVSSAPQPKAPKPVSVAKPAPIAKPKQVVAAPAPVVKAKPVPAAPQPAVPTQPAPKAAAKP